MYIYVCKSISICIAMCTYKSYNVVKHDNDSNDTQAQTGSQNILAVITMGCKMVHKMVRSPDRQTDRQTERQTH